MSFLDADYAAIEARIVNWLAGQEDALSEYRAGVDRYKVMASMIYRVPAETVNKHPQRFVGKQAVLGCIAEGELVLTDAGLVPIEKVCSWHRLWDGVEWVNHEGLIYQGQKQVISYQGIVATPDHPVYCVGLSRTTDLWTAREQKFRLTVSGEGRTPIRTLDAFDESSISQSRWIPEYEGALRMWNGDVSRLLELEKGFEQRLRSLRARGQQNLFCSQVAYQAYGRSAFSMRQSTQSRVQELRSEGNRVPVRVSERSSELDHGELGTEARFGNRPEEQQWALRAGEPAVCDSKNAGVELPNSKNGFYLSHPRVALLLAGGLEVSKDGADSETNFSQSSGSRSNEAKTLESDRKTVACFDILNAGPRHRFTVSGKLVHNCGFGMGPPKFRVTCWKMGRYDLPAGLEDTAVKAFRAKHKKVVQCWYDLERAAKQAILQKGKTFQVRHLLFQSRDVEGMPFLLMRLPSGRKLAYPRPRISHDRIVFFGNIKGTTWGDVNTWGGTLLENATQAVAADVMTNGVHKSERAGYETATLIHDQCLAYVKPGQTPDEFVRLLTDLPEWASGLPIEAEGGIVSFYKKD